LLDEELAASADKTGTLGGDETALLTAGGISTHGSGVTHVLMVTTTMGMFDGVHRNTSHAGEVVLLCVGLVVSFVGLEEGLVGTLTAGTDSNHSTAGSLDRLTLSRGETNTGLFAVFGVADDDGGAAGSAGEASTVTQFGLDVGDNGAFGHGVHGENIANSQSGFGSGVDELSSVHALNSDEIFIVLLEFVLVSETDLGERSSTARVVDNILHNSLDVSSALCEVQSSEAGRGDSL
jgi:hypothetical protein